MKSGKVKYTDDKGEMAGELVRIKDFLPPPDQPVESVTVTRVTNDKFVIRASEGDYDALEPFLVEAGIHYKRSKLTQFSIDPVQATILTIVAANAIIKPLATAFVAYLKERKRRIAITKSDGTILVAENYNVEEIERLLPESLTESHGQIDIESPAEN